MCLFSTFALFSEPSPDFSARIFSIGQNFLESYDLYLSSDDEMILLESVNMVKKSCENFMQSENYEKFAEENRDFRYFFKRILIDIDSIQSRIGKGLQGEIQSFSNDLSQMLFLISDYRTDYVNRRQQAFFTKIVRIAVYIAIFMILLILIFIAYSSFLKIRQDQKVILNLFSIVQESLTNIEKHAKASHCSLYLKNSHGKKSIIVYINDDGIGFDTNIFYNPRVTDKLNMHFGLQSMKNRATLIGAKLEISSASEDGTEVRIELPV